MTCITGYTLVRYDRGSWRSICWLSKAEPDGSLPIHMDWLYQVIPTRLLRVRERGKQTADEYFAGPPKRVFFNQL